MGVYAKRAFLHTSDRFLAGLYAEWPVLHTSGWFLDGLYAGMAVLHTDWEENHQTVENQGRDLEQKQPKTHQVTLRRPRPGAKRRNLGGDCQAPPPLRAGRKCGENLPA